VNAYPDTAAARDRFVLDRRGPRRRHDPWRSQELIVEDERDADGHPARTATVLLTGRECPWRCAMCDLWAYTTDEDTPCGAIPAQITAAREELASRREAVAGIKLYNAGSFFDPQAIPVDDFEEIAEAVSGFDRVIVEAHPAFLRGHHGDACLRFRDRLRGQLEVAVGLETVHREALAALHKRMTVEDAAEAAAFLSRHGIALRMFVLLDPPFVPHHDAADWALNSVRTAGGMGAAVCAVIPTRGGNGAIDALPVESRPRLGLRDLEWVVQEALGDGRRMRVFADLWDIERLFDCSCSRDRAALSSRSWRELQLIACSRRSDRTSRLCA